MWISLSTFFCSEVIFKVNVVWPHMTSLYTSLSSSSQTRLCADVFFGKRVVSHDFFHLSFWPGPKTTVDFCRAAGGSTCCCLVWWTQHWCGCRAFQWGLVAGGLTGRVCCRCELSIFCCMVVVEAVEVKTFLRASVWPFWLARGEPWPEFIGFILSSFLFSWALL